MLRILHKTPKSFGARSFTPTRGRLDRNAILALPSVPSISPAYPKGPYTFKNREYLIISYETDPEALKRVVPKPLTPAGNKVLYEWINMPDSSGFGSYQESGTVIPCTLPDGTPVSYCAQMFLDCEPPIAAGREIWGFPKKYALPKFTTQNDTLCGELTYAGVKSATGTMVFKHKALPTAKALEALSKLSCNLRIIPDVDGGQKRAQLIGYNLKDIEIIEAWEGPARLSLTPHVNCPTADLPVRKIIGGTHIKANLLLPSGRVLYDYLKNGTVTKESGVMTEADVRDLPSMPPLSPSYTPNVNNLLNSVTKFSVSYKTDPEVLLEHLPAELVLEDDVIEVSWNNVPSSVFGSYNRCSLYAHVSLNGKQYRFDLLSVSDSSSAITAGREMFGRSSKFGHPSLETKNDTIVGSVMYRNSNVLTATMPYSHQKMSSVELYSKIGVPDLNLKFVPGCDFTPDIVQLVEIQQHDPRIASGYTGPARVATQSHVNAPFDDFPVLSQAEGTYMHLEDLELRAKVVYDYLE